MDPLTLDAVARALGADPLPVEQASRVATGAVDMGDSERAHLD